MPLFPHGCSLRYLQSNQLAGTIPPQLGNLTALQILYAQRRIDIFAITSYISEDPSSMISIIVGIHYFIVALSGSSTRICSLAPSLLSSANSGIYNKCTQNHIFCIDNVYSIQWSSFMPLYVSLCALILIVSLRNLNSNQLTGTIPPELGNLTKQFNLLYARNRLFLMLLLLLLMISQVPLLESAHWHHPTCSLQPYSTDSAVRSESHGFIVVVDYVFCDILCFYWC